MIVEISFRKEISQNFRFINDKAYILITHIIHLVAHTYISIRTFI